MEKRTPLVDEHLLAMQSMEEIGTDDFFYTRLKARMLAHREGGQREHSQQGWSFPLKPVWIVSTLVLLLVVNGFYAIATIQIQRNKICIGNLHRRYKTCFLVRPKLFHHLIEIMKHELWNKK